MGSDTVAPGFRTRWINVRYTHLGGRLPERRAHRRRGHTRCGREVTFQFYLNRNAFRGLSKSVSRVKILFRL